MKKNIIQLLISLTFAVILFVSVASFAMADENCVTSEYGGGQVCGVSTPPTPHVPVNAGLGDVSIPALGAGFLAIAGVVYVYSKRLASQAS